MAGILILAATPAFAEFDLECYIKNNCPNSWRGRSTNPSSGGQVRINPSSVPTEKALGVEGIYFDDEVDFAIVQGLGRVGAAISPSNSEETFFGPPGFEEDEDSLERHMGFHKFPNQKITVASAVNLVNKKGTGLKHVRLSLGAMGKYNKATKNVTPGGGLSGYLGFLTFGASYYLDETQLGMDLEKELRPKPRKYNVQTYSVGMFLKSVILDYSYLRLKENEVETPSTVTLITGSLLLKNFIFTLSKRHEESPKMKYNFETKILEDVRSRDDLFGGVQYSIDRHLMVGAFYNYYLLQELSLSATLFF